LELSTRPDKNTIGTDEEWVGATEGLKSALEAYGKPFRINEGDGAFYGPKIDFHVQDAINRTWQCGTIQLDMALPDKFGLEYTAQDGSRQKPVMIHRAVLGSIERFFGILIEHFAGRFPLWINPLQVRIIAVADRHELHAQKVCQQIRAAGFECDIDASHESVSKKVRNAQLQQVNYLLTIGDQEVTNNTISLRTRDNLLIGSMFLADFLQTIEEERSQRLLRSPYMQGGE
jgi:threonyl-tRNA synthetase